MTGSAPLDKIANGFRDRTLVTLGLATRLGMKMLKKTVRPDAPPPEVEEAEAERSATALAAQLGQLKGLVMKFGQMASYLDGALPPGAQRALAKLQSSTTPMAPERVDELILAELGAPAHVAFDEFARTPFAAASIGQVHRARLFGDEVVVKVQYPGIEAAIRSDLRTIGGLVRWSLVGSASDGKAVSGEIAARLLEECDYGLEAHNQQLFGRMFQDDPRVVVPEVHVQRSTRRVLTSTFVAGRAFQHVCERAAQSVKDRAAHTIFDVAYTSIFRHCIFNADPHPGNYLFRDDGKVALLDFGCVRRFDRDMIDRWKRMALSAMRGDRARFREGAIELGLAPAAKKFDWESYYDAIQYLYLPVTSKKPFTFTQEYVAKSYDLLIWRNPNRYRAVVPPEWVFVNRLQWGLYSLLAHLHATADWRTAWVTALESETTPAI